MITSNNFAANVITKSLYNKLLGGGQEFLQASRTLYVSTNGTSTGDGTQANPFATFSNALDYYNRHLFARGYTVSIDFLTDYDDSTADLRTNFHYIGVQHSSPSNGTLRIVNSQSKDVVLKGIWASGGYLEIRDVSIKSTGSGSGIIAHHNAAILLTGTISVQCTSTVSGNACLWAQRGGTLYFDANTDITLKTTTPRTAAVVIELNGTLSRATIGTGALSQIHLDGAFVNFIIVRQNGSFLLARYAQSDWVNEPEGGRKFICQSNSVIITANKGADWLAGTLAGTVDNTSIYD